ncbi:hypothetical protein HDU82_004329 [Entophlyctis luteolus]|nr:hypothetical protein HDU82_004329 [Entophlyctis luteolus]
MTSDLAVPLQDTNTVQIVRNLDHLDALDNLVKSHLALVTYLESKIERRQSGLQSGPGKAVKPNIIRSDLLQVKGILKSDQSRAACAEGGVSHQESSSRKVTFHHEVRKIQSSSSFVDTELWDDPGDYLTWKRNVNLGEEAGAMSSIASFSETSGSKESIYFDAESEGISDGDDGTDTELA